jgi:hypothetical protein
MLLAGAAQQGLLLELVFMGACCGRVGLGSPCRPVNNIRVPWVTVFDTCQLDVACRVLPFLLERHWMCVACARVYRMQSGVWACVSARRVSVCLLLSSCLQVIKEVLRYRPPAPMVPQVAMKPFKLTDNYTVRTPWEATQACRAHCAFMLPPRLSPLCLKSRMIWKFKVEGVTRACVCWGRGGASTPACCVCSSPASLWR